MDTKCCTKCGTEYPANTRFFYKHHSTKDGLDGRCVTCALQATREYRKNNIDKVLARRKKYRKNNPEKVKESNRIYRENNRDKRNADKAKRRATKKQATPPWYDTEHKDIQSLYKKAKEVGSHVDHIIPLVNKLVCGLHTIANLQLLSPTENMSKSNKFDPLSYS